MLILKLILIYTFFTLTLCVQSITCATSSYCARNKYGSERFFKDFNSLEFRAVQH